LSIEKVIACEKIQLNLSTKVSFERLKNDNFAKGEELRARG